MPSPEARLKKLEKKAAKLEAALKKANTALKQAKVNSNKLKTRVAKLEKSRNSIVKWIKLEAEWSEEVTMMLRMIDWNKLSLDYPGGGGVNPPQTPPDWPID
jgi:phage shock protein A